MERRIHLIFIGLLIIGLIGYLILNNLWVCYVFAHLAGDSGPVAQADGLPVCWSYPTDLWRPGQIIADQHAISIPPDTPPGPYPLQVGFYQPDTFERLDVLDIAGNPAGVSITLTDVEIRN